MSSAGLSALTYAHLWRKPSSADLAEVIILLAHLIHCNLKQGFNHRGHGGRRTAHSQSKNNDSFISEYHANRPTVGPVSGSRRVRE